MNRPATTARSTTTGGRDIPVAPPPGRPRTCPDCYDGYRFALPAGRPRMPRAVPCDCVVRACVCGAMHDLDPTPGPSYDRAREVAADVPDETSCPCYPVRQRVRTVNNLLGRSNIGTSARMLDAVRTDLDGRPLPETKKALHNARELVENELRGNPGRGLYLFGPAGDGKTHLASCLLTELIVRTARAGRFVNVGRDLFPRIRETYDDQKKAGESEMSIMRELSRVPYIVLDDFGVQRGTEWQAEILYNLIDARYRRRLPVIVTSNLSIEDTEPLSRGRIASRFRQMTRSIRMPDADLRPFFDYTL